MEVATEGLMGALMSGRLEGAAMIEASSTTVSAAKLVVRVAVPSMR